MASLNKPTLTELRLALRRLRLDRPDRVFVEHPHSTLWLTSEVDSWLKELRGSLREGYEPNVCRVSFVPKSNNLFRPASIIDPEDELVYCLLVGRVLRHVPTPLLDHQGVLDFAYQLPRDVTTPKWTKRGPRAWQQWRTQSVAKIDNGFQYAVVGDITGFYENIDLAKLFSDLRSIGCSTEDLGLLRTCLEKWGQIRGKGIPQGYSASDILAKIYLHSVDQALLNEDYDHLRYVDDFRIFTHTRAEAQQAILRLTELLYRRGLNLQAAKTDILPKEEARRKFDGVGPRIRDIQEELRIEVEKDYQGSDPYLPPAKVVALLGDSEGPPVEVLERAFEENFSELGEPKFDSTLFHYLLYRLGVARSEIALTFAVQTVSRRPEETSYILTYLQALLPLSSDVLGHVADAASRALTDHQRYQIMRWFWANELGHVKPLALSRLIMTDFNREPWLRTTAMCYLGRFGDTSDLETLEELYPRLATDEERAHCVLALSRQEKARRNAFFSRVQAESRLITLAVKTAKSDH